MKLVRYSLYDMICEVVPRTAFGLVKKSGPFVDSTKGKLPTRPEFAAGFGNSIRYQSNNAAVASSSGAGVLVGCCTGGTTSSGVAQDELPAYAILPAGQAKHAVCRLAPTIVEYFPESQFLHGSLPISDLYLPATHIEQAPPFGPVVP